MHRRDRGRKATGGSRTRKPIALLASLAVIVSTLALSFMMMGTSSAATSNPLTIEGDPLRITVYDDSTFAVFRNEGGSYVKQYYNNYAKGSILYVNGSDKNSSWGGGASTFELYGNHFTAVSHTQPDPWTINTVYQAGSSGVSINETVTYRNGNSYYRVKYDIKNNGGNTYSDLRFMNGADVYFAGDDSSMGYWTPTTSMVYVRNPDVTGMMGLFGDFVQSPANHYMEGFYSTVEAQCLSGNHLPDTVNPTDIDSGYALEWDRAALAPGETWTVVSYEKWFSVGDVQVYAAGGVGGNPGDTVTVPFVVQNFEASADTFKLTPTSSNGWAVSAAASVNLNSGEAKRVDVQLAIPSPTAVALDTVTLEARSQTNTAIFNSDRTDVEVYGNTLAPGFYFAEGYTGTGFEEYLCIGNAGDSAQTANVTYLFKDGSAPVDKSYNVSAQSRTTVNVNNEVGANREVSIRMNSPAKGLTAERPMYFNYSDKWRGGDNVLGYSPGVASAANWYFAEGTTRTEFDEYITVLNPNSQAANLTFRYMIEGEGEQVKTEQVGANSRGTFSVAGHVGTGKDLSLHLHSDVNVVAERPMYFNYMGLGSHNWTGGHCVVGINAPGKAWSFAEGTTRDNSTDGTFEEWLCMQNPGQSEITIRARYLLGPGQGNPIEKDYRIPGKERRTISVNSEVGAQKDVSVKLTSDNDFIAERPMYFVYNNKWDGGHNVMATSKLGKEWFFAEGYTGQNFEEWLCLQNPGGTDANVQITYYPTNGSPHTTSHTVSANSRYTVNVNRDAGADLEISAKVVSDQDIIAERPIYFYYNGQYPGGSDVVGYTP